MNIYDFVYRFWPVFADLVIILSLGALIVGVFLFDTKSKGHDLFIIAGTFMTLYIVGTLEALQFTTHNYVYVTWLVLIMAFVAYLAFRLVGSRFRVLFFSPVALAILVSVINPLVEDRGFGCHLASCWIA